MSTVLIKKFGPFEYARIPSWGDPGSIRKYGRFSWWRRHDGGIVLRYKAHQLHVKRPPIARP